MEAVVDQPLRDVLDGDPGRILDRPEIDDAFVRDVSRVLAARKVSIDSLDTEYVSGSWSGENLFRAHARLRIPAGMPDAELRSALEAIADELMVDISLHELAEG